jgi:hypothetical protein
MLCYAYTADLIRFSQKREVSDRLGYEAATLGVWFPDVWDDVALSYLWVTVSQLKNKAIPFPTF